MSNLLRDANVPCYSIMFFVLTSRYYNFELIFEADYAAPGVR